jgi:hypothetical protein
MTTQPITYRTVVALIAAALLFAWSSCASGPRQSVPAPVPVELAP